MSLFYNLFLILISTSTFSHAQSAACNIPEKINFRLSADGAKFATLELPQDWETAESSKSATILDYKNMVSSKTSVDAKYLLDRQRSLFESFPKIVERMTRILEGQLGKIDEAGCLETSILSVILNEYPGQHQIEYSVYILKEGTGPNQKFRAHILTWGMTHVPESPNIQLLVDQDLKAGWQYYAHLHNHPFYLNNPTGDIAGAVVPSEPDLTSYLNDQQVRGLQNAWVTNGFSTFKLNGSDFNH